MAAAPPTVHPPSHTATKRLFPAAVLPIASERIAETSPRSHPHNQNPRNKISPKFFVEGILMTSPAGVSKTEALAVGTATLAIRVPPFLFPMLLGVSRRDS